MHLTTRWSPTCAPPKQRSKTTVLRTARHHQMPPHRGGIFALGLSAGKMKLRKDIDFPRLDCWEGYSVNQGEPAARQSLSPSRLRRATSPPTSRGRGTGVLPSPARKTDVCGGHRDLSDRTANCVARVSSPSQSGREVARQSRDGEEEGRRRDTRKV